MATPTKGNRKRKAKAKTPVVDDEVRRSARLKGIHKDKLIQLENEPGRKKGDKKKSVSFTSVSDEKRAMLTDNLQIDDTVEVEPIEANTLVDFGSELCGVLPGELSKDDLLQERSE